MTTTDTGCCIVGGGPAGMMLGLLLARQGVDTMVLEKHADFLRDFRGDTIHPSTLEVVDELGFIDEFLRLPHSELRDISMETPAGRLTLADFRRLPGRYQYVAFLPQWDFLDFLAEKARAFPTFRLLTLAEVNGVIEENGRIVGVRARTADGALEVRATLVVAADGRHSTLRDLAALELTASSPQMDVLWFRLGRRAGEAVPFLRVRGRDALISIDRGEHWQLGLVIPKGGYDELRAAGLDAFRARVSTAGPEMTDRLHEIRDWEDVKLLTVRVDRLRQWFRPGLLCIGDAAHAMSPVGGVGINLAIQDAVAAANLLGPTFRSGGPTVRDLRRVQRRRELPTRVTQAFQLQAGRGAQRGTGPPPLVAALLRHVPAVSRMLGRFVGLGIRPEHVQPRG